MDDTLISSPTTSIDKVSKTSNVTPDTPTAGEEVVPISTSSSGRVIRRPSLYKNTRRWYLEFLFSSSCSFRCEFVSFFRVELTFLYFGSFTPLFFFTFPRSLGIRVGATTNLEGGSGRVVDLPSFV